MSSRTTGVELSPPDAAAASRDGGTVLGLPEGGGAALARGARWLTAGTLVVGVVNYAYAFLLTRLLSPSSYAEFAAGQALLLTAGTVAAVSVPWVLAQELAQRAGEGEQRRRAVWFATLTNLAQGAVLGAASGLLTTTFAGPAAAVAVAVGTLLIFLSSTSLGWFQGSQRFRAIAARGVVEVATKAGVGLVLVLTGAGAASALAGFGAGAAVILLGGTWLMRGDYGRVSGALADRALWQSTRGVAAVQGLVSVLASVDVVLVAVLPVASHAAASYQASMILARVPLFLAGAVAAVAFPMFGAADSSPSVLLRSGNRLYLVVAVPLALALITAPDAVLAPLFPGTFDQVGHLLPFTAVAGLLIGLVELQTTFFQAGGQYRTCVRRQGAGVAVSLVAVPLAWSAWGVTGIAVAACLGATVSAALLVQAAGRTWPGSRPGSARGYALVVALTAVLLVLRTQPLLWLLAAGVVLAVCAWSVFLRPTADPVAAGRP